jgi:gamma-glutamylcyclotransferase (GGCT)/AIG2-like uncharacterized protein YtfP
MKNKNDFILLAVYGTLLQGYGNNRLLENSTLLGEGKTVDKFQMHASGFPMVNNVNKNVNIHCEVYQVPLNDLPRIDSLEGHPVWYERKPIKVKLNNGEVVIAELYFNNQEAVNARWKEVPSGNFHVHTGKVQEETLVPVENNL